MPCAPGNNTMLAKRNASANRTQGPPRGVSTYSRSTAISPDASSPTTSTQHAIGIKVGRTDGIFRATVFVLSLIVRSRIVRMRDSCFQRHRFQPSHRARFATSLAIDDTEPRRWKHSLAGLSPSFRLIRLVCSPFQEWQRRRVACNQPKTGNLKPSGIEQWREVTKLQSMAPAF